MQIIDTFQNRLKKAMEYRNIKQVDLVEKTKLDKTLINKYLSGVANAKQKKLAILAKALDVDEVWLMGYDTSMGNSTSTKLDKLENNVVPINIFDGVVSDFNVLFPKNIIGTVDIEKSIINNGDNFFALKVKDDSMSPVLIENDIIVIIARNRKTYNWIFLPAKGIYLLFWHTYTSFRCFSSISHSLGI